MTDSTYATLGSSPVPGETAAGEDARYEPEYAAVLEEVEKLSFSGEGATVSWPAIEKNAVAILSEKSKDLQIASYLGVALWHNKGIDGVLYGMQILTDWLDTYWETGWPALKRMRGRVNAVDWWHERTYAFVQDPEGNQIPPISPQLHQQLLDATARLDERIGERMPDASSLRDLSAAISRLGFIEAAPKAPATPAQDAAPVPSSDGDAITHEPAAEASNEAESFPEKTDAQEPGAASASAFDNASATAPNLGSEDSAGVAPAPSGTTLSAPDAISGTAPDAEPGPPHSQTAGQASGQASEQASGQAVGQHPADSGVAPANASGQFTPPPGSLPAEEVEPLRRQFVAAGLSYLAAAKLYEGNKATLWQLSRLLVWGAIKALPPSEQGQTMLPAPDMDALARARQKLDAGKAYAAALDAEEIFSMAPFCLDAQELTHAALRALGPAYAQAARLVVQETLAFVARFPGIEHLAFTDGTPFASPATLQWLQSSLRQQGHSAPKASSGPDPTAQILEKAEKVLQEQGLEQALSELDAAKGACGAKNFRLRIHQLRLLLENGKNTAALALAESLLQECRDCNLESWDPDIAIEALCAIQQACMQAPGPHAELPGLRRLLARLCPGAVQDAL